MEKEEQIQMINDLGRNSTSTIGGGGTGGPRNHVSNVFSNEQLL